MFTYYYFTFINDCKYMFFKNNDLVNMCMTLKYQLAVMESDLCAKVDRIEQKINQLMSSVNSDKICYVP